jgi:3-deoxy-manno-octulosonate cytidylyltransferase (CMP-KDO synthetase)
MKKFIAVIPARYESIRFPGKPLALLKGKFLIQQVYERVKSTNLFDEVYVATDNEKIFHVVKGFNGKVVMTDPGHKSGTDRVAEVCSKIDFDVVVNIQGDEPFINKITLQKLLNCFADKKVQTASLMHPFTEEISNPNFVKVITDDNGDAVYFSRSVIPFNRDNSKIEYFHHIGVYAFRKGALLDFVSLPEGKLEKTEKLEQLRLLENGRKIRMVLTDYEGFGIDTEADLLKAEKLL